MQEKIRLDILLTNKQLCETRSRAKQLISHGLVKVNGNIVKKAGTLVNTESTIEIDNSLLKYVSRSGNKLEHALTKFNIDLQDALCLDIGASTGGFTECMLNFGAKKVFAVDVGTNQLHRKLKENQLVVSLEQTDIRNFTPPDNIKFDFIAVDVSFISVTKITAKIAELLAPGGKAVILIKPQFEAGKNGVNHKGIVRNKALRQNAIEKVKKSALQNGLQTLKIIQSPIKGKDGNIEFLAYLKKAAK